MSKNNYFINDNFAVFSNSSSTKHKYDIYINDWLVYPTGNYIDFGIRLYDLPNINSLYIYVPYKINLEDIQDLAPLFGNEKTARAIINTNIKIIASTSSPIIEISYSKGKDTIIFLSLLNYSLRTCENGTLISFSFDKVHTHFKDCNCYIRFRIPHKSLDRIYTSKKHDYKFSLNSPIITDVYQHTIRINEFRSLPIEVRQMLSTGEEPIIKAHFFLSSNDEIDINNNVCENIRPLENDLFEEYIPKTFKTQNALVYQWVKKPSKYLSFSFKCSTSKIQILSLSIYCIIVVFLAIVANILWELLKHSPLFNWLV